MFLFVSDIFKGIHKNVEKLSWVNSLRHCHVFHIIYRYAVGVPGHTSIHPSMVMSPFRAVPGCSDEILPTRTEHLWTRAENVVTQPKPT